MSVTAGRRAQARVALLRGAVSPRLHGENRAVDDSDGKGLGGALPASEATPGLVLAFLVCLRGAWRPVAGEAQASAE